MKVGCGGARFDGVSLQGGREVLLWGPSMFWNPSNPFFIENNKNNPKREIAGKEFVRARWQVSSDLALTAIGQLGRGPRTVGTQRMAGFKLDWTGEEASAAAIVAAEPGKTPSWQGWAQWTANDATLVYGEVAWRVSQLYNLPAVAESATDVSIGTSRSHRGLLAVLGMSYTFENNWTLYTEYWHNGNGLDDGDARRLAQAVRTLGTRPRGVADRQLALLLEQPSPLRRNYLGVQLGGGETNDVSWKLRLTTDIDDGSVEGVVMVDKDLGDQLKLWLNLMRRAGGSATDYGRWVIDSVMIGATWYAW
ncbi:MAG: hypothetical protein QM803_05665 [Rhodocyclaceae bacterium]